MQSEQLFGDYRLIDLIGRGGMGEVYRAFDTTTERMVALKVLPQHLVEDDNFQQRFRREALAAAGLNEPHVVPIHRFGEIDGRLYVDMRLIEGRDLEAVLQTGPLAPQRAVDITRQVSAALTAAHRVGLVHRDVKPSNILVTDDDFAYLIDFGIARNVNQSALTSTGVAVGTFAYMAPERFRDQNPDPRSDVYALAAVLYQCLTGRRPFAGDNAEQQMMAHLTAPPPRPSALQHALPAGFDDVIAKGMAKNPDDRYQTASELAQAAQHVVAALGPSSTSSVLATEPAQKAPLPRNTSAPQSPKRRRNALLATCAAIVVATAAVVAVLHFGGSRTQSTTAGSATTSNVPATRIDSLMLSTAEVAAATGIADLRPNSARNKAPSISPTNPPECAPVFNFFVDSLINVSGNAQLRSITYKFTKGNSDGLIGQGVLELPSPEVATEVLNRITAAWRQCEGKVYQGSDTSNPYQLSPLVVSTDRTSAVAINQRRNNLRCEDVVATVQNYVIKTEACGNIDATVGNRLADALAAKVRG